MHRSIRNFLKSDSGAVTVDWVVLTAGIIALMFLLVLTPVREAVRGLATDIGTELGNIRTSLFGSPAPDDDSAAQG